MGTSRRDPTLDIIRGLCIVSMVIGHLADGSPLYAVTHGQIWVDGATGFVLLAGLVLGMVQRRSRPVPGAVLLARRARLVWAAHVALVVLALLMAPWRQMYPAATAPADERGGWLPALWQAATLRLNPIDVDILSMYVLLFGVAAVAVVLLRARLLWLLVTVSVAVYAVGLGAPSWASLPRYAGGAGTHFNIATWQALFLSAFVLGWYWRSPRVQALLADQRTWRVTVGVVGGAFLLHQLVERFGVLASLPGPEAVVRTVFDNSTLGVGRIVLGWAVFAVLYRALRSRRAAVGVAPLARVCEPLGRRSLAAYVILTVFDLLLPSLAPYDTTGWIAVQWAVLVVGAAWLWSRWRDGPVGERVRWVDGGARSDAVGALQRSPVAP